MVTAECFRRGTDVGEMLRRQRADVVTAGGLDVEERDRDVLPLQSAAFSHPFSIRRMLGETAASGSGADKSSRHDEEMTPRAEHNSTPMTDSAVRQTPCLLYTSPSPRDRQKSRMPSSA